MKLQNKLSIKSLTIMNLIIIGISAIALSFITSVLFKAVALEDEIKIVKQMTAVTAKTILDHTYEQASIFGLSAGKSRKFRRAFKSIKQAENKEFVVQTLDKQFTKKHVSEGIVNLVKIRVYDKGFKLLAQSNKGINNLPKKLPDTLYKRVKKRKGSERLKTAHALWSSPSGVVASALIPVGGLRLRGYMEIIVTPVSSLVELEHTLGIPIQILDAKNKQLYRSNTWVSNNNDMLPIEYYLKAGSGKTGLKIRVLENLTEFNQTFTENMFFSITLFVVLIIFNIIATQVLFSRFIFKPLKKLADDMQQCARGDLTIKIENNDLSELKTIGDSFSLFLASLKTQVSELQTNATHISNTSTVLTTITDETTEGAKKQQDETKEVATAINEMSATVLEVANHAEDASQAAQNAEKETNKGKQIVSDTIRNINDLENDLTNSANVLETLKSESENIGSVMNVIQGIAEQTNLLSLNAAIEAARAGEQGRGFAVVADEVRVLANRTQDSSKEIQSMIEKIQTGASQAVNAMNTSRNNTKTTIDQAALAGESLESVANAVKNISDMNIQIASAAEEQRAVTNEIGKSIENINKISSVTTISSSKTATASKSLLEFAQNLNNLIVKFKV